MKNFISNKLRTNFLLLISAISPNLYANTLLWCEPEDRRESIYRGDYEKKANPDPSLDDFLSEKIYHILMLSDDFTSSQLENTDDVIRGHACFYSQRIKTANEYYERHKRIGQYHLDTKVFIKDEFIINHRGSHFRGGAREIVRQLKMGTTTENAVICDRDWKKTIDKYSLTYNAADTFVIRSIDRASLEFELSCPAKTRIKNSKYPVSYFESNCGVIDTPLKSDCKVVSEESAVALLNEVNKEKLSVLESVRERFQKEKKARRDAVIKAEQKVKI